MPFQFPLQTVLHLRQSIEHQQELRLRAANQLVARARHLIGQIDDRIQEAHNRQASELTSGTTAAEIRFTLQCEVALLQQKAAIQQELPRLQKLRDEQQIIFQRARRERETLGSLRERQLQAYQRECSRRAQRQLDDLFLLRQAYLRRG